MKKLFLFVLMTCFAANMYAQQVMPLQRDPNVRFGVLDNGLTYYLRHNEKPSQRADFYIAQKVGSVLEEENQRGLAHFLEHMAFNGTENLPGQMLRDYLQDNGVKFGENLNAGTGIDQTVYMVTNVPTTNPGLLDTCLLILHDWSSFISLDESEIDKERGVILEELRTTDNAQQRTMEKMLEDIYPNSPYANRLPGGLPEVVANFEYQTLRDYYHKWYRPDLQGIIVVGDIDVDAMENRIIEMFSDIKAPVNPAERPFFYIEDNVEPLVSICTDPELTNYQIQVMYKHDAFPDSLKNDANYLVFDYMISLIGDMFNNRINEIIQKANPPFVYAYGYYGDFYVSPTKDAWNLFAMPKDSDGIDEALTAIVEESNRLCQYGFTASEYERAKADYLEKLERRYEERNNTENRVYVNQCLNNFLENEPMMGIEQEYAFMQQIVPNMPLEVINMVVKEFIPENNLVLTLVAPEKEGEVIPTKEEFLNMYNEAFNKAVEPYFEEVYDGPMVENMPKPGKIKKEIEMPEFGATALILNNGVKVIYKQTNFKDAEIVMSAYSVGGISAVKDDDYTTLKEVSNIIDLGGVGNFSAVDLPKVLAGKSVSVTPEINYYSEGFSGTCTPKDLETMMQLVYLYFTQPRADEEAFNSYIQRSKSLLKNLELNPMVTFSDSITSLLYDNNPLATRLKMDDYDNIDYAKAMEIYKDRFADPNNFVFTFVGNLDVETFKPLVEQYLGSLKKMKRKETWQDVGLGFTPKDKVIHYKKQMENPKTTVYLVYNGEMDYNFENMVYMSVLSDILDIVYTRSIREEEGGTYGVGVQGTVINRPDDSFYLLIAFDTNDDVYAKLVDIAKSELENIANNGPLQEDLSKVLENKLKKRAELLEDNNFWDQAIMNYENDKINIIENYEEIIKSINVQTIADFTKNVINKYQKEIIQRPEK